MSGTGAAPAGPGLPDQGQFALTVDLAIFTIRDGAFTVLLVQRGSDPFRGRWALPGGFVRPQESVEAAAWRELAAETGMSRFPGHLEQLRTYGDTGRDPRLRAVSVAHVAFAPDLPDPTTGPSGTGTSSTRTSSTRPSSTRTSSTRTSSTGASMTGPRWWAVEDLEEVPLAFDHAQILTDAIERVRSKLEYTTLATRFVSEPFSLKDLYRVYQAVWGLSPDLPGFRRKVLSTNGFVVPVPAPSPEPVLLYRRGAADVLQPAMLRTTADDADERE